MRGTIDKWLATKICSPTQEVVLAYYQSFEDLPSRWNSFYPCLPCACLPAAPNLQLVTREPLQIFVRSSPSSSLYPPLNDYFSTKDLLHELILNNLNFNVCRSSPEAKRDEILNLLTKHYSMMLDSETVLTVARNASSINFRDKELSALVTDIEVKSFTAFSTHVPSPISFVIAKCHIWRAFR